MLVGMYNRSLIILILLLAEYYHIYISKKKGMEKGLDQLLPWPLTSLHVH